MSLRETDPVRGFIRTFNAFLVGFMEVDADVDTRRKVFLLFFTSIIGVVNLVPLGLLALYQGNTGLGSLDLVLAVILAGNVLHARRHGKYAVNIYLGVIAAALLYIYAFLTGGVNQSAFVWYFTFPLMACYLLGSRRGALASLAILIPAVTLFLFDDPPSFLADYDFDFKMRFIPSFLVVCVFSFISEHAREKSREELRRAQGELEDRVAERTSQLRRANTDLKSEISERRRAEEALRGATEDLERQNEKLKQLDKVKDGLIRDVSHELKTPVAKQAMQLELLKASLDRAGCGDDLKKPLEVMDEAVRRQEKTIRNILELSRLESGGRSRFREPVDLAEALTRIVQDHADVTAAKGIEVVMDLDPLEITSDGDMLWHVFSNLVNNAIKFSGNDATGRVTVSLGREDGMAVIRIKDEGIGMTAEEARQVFERFYQATSAIEGCGVGLTICKMIVEELGGRIGVESEGPACGTTVTVLLPL